ncbi:hypothetical protein TVAG_292800 [Trichomonas vaginalis G3]|uniref:Uncharacterized protein n=1 Tax=Trichomonas vaginalis (strain ATCC PRA-98 / G3) TaxID=412133 RepID=A2F0F2_TRIV3|nr:hypothetical protein TVAGG3_0216750 [Trichomonas vaginalis G3]EAY01647.1 hypothetical protein TVAG_292800 [Trichomonas vaginalis G3]KAI5551614.1 hypothetical protein TVAGG3_0216750 [Trichomonas vaginalis G3]|eukprot:XP_001330379.1 hypothetical protein [Trichomonas vaginalis G3]
MNHLFLRLTSDGSGSSIRSIVLSESFWHSESFHPTRKVLPSDRKKFFPTTGKKFPDNWKKISRQLEKNFPTTGKKFPVVRP